MKPFSLIFKRSEKGIAKKSFQIVVLQLDFVNTALQEWKTELQRTAHKRIDEGRLRQLLLNIVQKIGPEPFSELIDESNKVKKSKERAAILAEIDKRLKDELIKHSADYFG